MIEIRPDNFYLGFWHFQFPHIEPLTHSFGNVLGCVWRRLDKPEGPWTLRYRFRYTVDQKSFDSDDERNWYEMVLNKPSEGPKTDSGIRANIDKVMARMSGGFGSQVDFYELMCDGDQAQRKMIEKPPSFMEVQQWHTA